MDIKEIYRELDSLNYTEIEGYLKGKIEEASAGELFEIEIPLLNEMIGFLRDTTQFDKGKAYKDELLRRLSYYGQQDNMNCATSLLNIANFDRAAGAYSESIAEYKQCEDIYSKLLPEGDYLWAGLYNNESLLYQMMGDNLAAIGALSKALRIVDAIPERRIEVATTYTNIAQSLAALGQMEEAEENVREALKIFAETDNKDYHYSAAAAVMGIIAYNRGDYKEAADYYNSAAEVVKSIMGVNENYELLISNRDAMLALIPVGDGLNDGLNDGSEADGDGDGGNSDPAVTSDAQMNADGEVNSEAKGLDICRSFYLKYGKPMLEDRFGSMLSKMTLGLFGEGSDCLGLDDELSRDHDWGPGFMILVSRAVYGEIGGALERAYAELPTEYMGYKRTATAEAGGRTGVIIIEDYLKKYLGEALLNKGGALVVNREALAVVPEYILANMVNGEIWHDGQGVISGIRKELAAYYDEKTWHKKLAYELIMAGKAGQYNLKRCLDRDDKVTAAIYLADFYKSSLRIMYLLNRKYAPYEKWLFKGASTLPEYAEVTDCLRAMADMDIQDPNLLMTIEIVAQIILSALKDKGLVAADEENWYLEKLGRGMLA